MDEPVNYDDVLRELNPNAVPLRQDEEFVIQLPAPPNDGRCVAGYGLVACGKPDSARCRNRATMPDLLCLACHLEFRPKKKG